jgi:NADH:ubiquinone oxidoreductase subunit F (NADH-binding)
VQGLFATTPNVGWSAGVGVATEFEAANPTVVNNVETLATVSQVLARGPEWHRSLGTERSPGFVVATVVGDVLTPGVGEVELGTPLRQVIDEVGGGLAPGRSVRAVLSGVSNPVVTGDQLDVPCSYEGMEAIGTGLGAAGFIVFDDTTSMVEVAQMISRFLYVESCGQCPACKLGTGEVSAYLGRIARGNGEPRHIELIGARLETVTDANRCYLGRQEQLVISSLLRAFPEDFVAHLEGAPPAEVLPVPLLVDIVDGVAVYDEKHARKRPDWTYTS